MAYNNTNKLRLILDVQNVYNEYKVEGMSTIHVYRKHIAPRFYISLTTFYNYLATPAKRELANREKSQLSLQMTCCP